MAESFVCKKFYILNHNKLDYEMDSNVKETLVTRTKGIHAGASSLHDTFDCPKEARDEKNTCLQCQFSVPASRSVDFEV